MGKLEIAIADDNESVIENLTKGLEKEPDFQIVGRAGDGEELLKIIREKTPDVVLLDIIMPKMDRCV